MRRLFLLCLSIAVLGLCNDRPAWAQKKKIDELIKELDSKNAAVRVNALNEIGDYAAIKLVYAQKALPQMREFLAKDPDVKIRVAALVALGKTEYENAEYIANMMKYLKEDKDFGVQGKCLELLANYQQAANGAIKPLKERMEELREMHKDQDPGGIRSGILNTIERINQGQSQPNAIEAIEEDKAVSVKITAVNRLAQIGQNGGARETAPLLIKTYEESLTAGPSPELRRSILNALSSIQPDPKNYLTLLTDTLKKDKDAGVLVGVIAALGRGGDAAKDAIPLVLEAQKSVVATAPKDGSDPGNQRRIVVDSISRLNPPAKEWVPVLLDTLKKEKDGGVRIAAINALGAVGADAKDALPTLVALHKAGTTVGFKDGNDPGDSRRLTLEALYKVENTIDAKALVNQLIDSVNRDKNPNVRSTAVKLLGELGAAAKPAEKVLLALQKLGKTPSEQEKALAKLATEALEKIKGS